MLPIFLSLLSEIVMQAEMYFYILPFINIQMVVYYTHDSTPLLIKQYALEIA